MSSLGRGSVPVDLHGRVAFLTGATSGLGRRFALVLAAAGAKVAIAGRREQRLEEVAETITSAGGEPLPIALDVGDTAACLEAIEHAERALGPVDILVNNAGMPDARYATKMPIELVDTVINVNLRGPFVLACEVARRLIAQRQPGRIVNVSSMSAYYYAGEGAALYSITKAAIGRMTEVLAVEWARFGINVCGIAPGAFDTEMMEGMVQRVGDMTAAYPRRRMGQPWQLDSTLLFLVDPASECVTGTTIKVDDGQLPR